MFKSFSLCHAPWNSAKAEQTSPLPKKGPVRAVVGFLRQVPCAGPCSVDSAANYESWVVPAGVPSALADIGRRVEANI